MPWPRNGRAWTRSALWSVDSVRPWGRTSPDVWRVRLARAWCQEALYRVIVDIRQHFTDTRMSHITRKQSRYALLCTTVTGFTMVSYKQDERVN
jgi:hypothetical protein